MTRWIGKLLGVLMLAAASGAPADEARKGQEVVDNATGVFQSFVANPDMKWFRDHVHDAKGLLIVPHYGKAGFIVGGAAGSGVLLGRDAGSGAWSMPAFYSLAEASIGLQIGAQGSKIIFLIMTDRGLRNLVDGKVQLGADMNVAAGPVGGGARAATADVLAFSQSKGVFGGVAAEGAVIQPFEERNSAYYGKPVSPEDVVLRRTVSNDGARRLIEVVSKKLGG